ncbi:ELAV-like protein 4 [Condylostylus longicornis]|uniref:ELAV-like protein 4 n=1 Tax=Condylostylus longicornis TaxID=2530218 RepID=UPI00244DCD49|nr:ELAV-like protein 4 [Condylostylus longicornis]
MSKLCNSNEEEDEKTENKNFLTGRIINEDENNIKNDKEEYSLYIYNLAPETDEEYLWRAFSPFGAIKKIVVMRDPETNISRGFAFVDMKNFNDANSAIEILNGTELNNKQLKINFKGQRNDDEQPFEEIAAYQLYVYNIPSDTSELRLFKLFGQFGGVKNVAIMKDRVKYSGTIAFVTMRKKDEAEKAIKTLNGFNLENHILQVRFKNQKGETLDNAKENLPRGDIQLYINNLDYFIEEQTIWKLFAHFGAVKDVNIMRDLSGRCIGYGFVTMKETRAASLAVNTLNGTNLAGRNLIVSFKTKKSKGS